MKMNLEDKIELEAQAITIEQNSSLPKGYLDGMLFAFDLVLMWIKESEGFFPCLKQCHKCKDKCLGYIHGNIKPNKPKGGVKTGRMRL